MKCGNDMEASIRRVMHADLDCFYAAVEELDNPALRGKPVVVGGDPVRRGVVSTANYIARRYGIHSAMSALQARRLCPHAIFLRPRFDRYRELSRTVMTILRETCLELEQVSIDEAYGELPPAARDCVPAERIARAIKAEVRAQTGLTISVGVGRTKSLAKLASDASKPDGCLIVRPSAERAFLDPLPVSRLNGVGPSTRERLEQLGIRTVGELASSTRAEVEAALGKHGVFLWQLANAEDDRPIVADSGPPKSISREDTFERDIADLETATTHIRALAASVAARAQSRHLPGRTITLKVKWADFQIMTRQQPLPEPTYEEELLAQHALALLHSEVAPALAEGRALRLLGVGLSNFVAAHTLLIRGDYVQPLLFAEW